VHLSYANQPIQSETQRLPPWVLHTFRAITPLPLDQDTKQLREVLLPHPLPLKLFKLASPKVAYPAPQQSFSPCLPLASSVSWLTPVLPCVISCLLCQTCSLFWGMVIYYIIFLIAKVSRSAGLSIPG
jgi:hypothetical protein